MSAIGEYSFLPWLRRGLGNQITAADDPATIPLRATIPVGLNLVGKALNGSEMTPKPVGRPVALFGPGDVVGVDARAIVRTEPRNWITDFEPNYLPFVEFYDEDFPWRYTPAAPIGLNRLRPWLALVVFEESEFEEGGSANAKEKPLPDILVSDRALFPDAAQLWAWAHVHVNRALSTGTESSDQAAIVAALATALAENPDLACSRILCPRKLRPGAAYHAFLVPTFESGRLAGLGLDPALSPNATASAWALTERPDPTRYPYYYRYYFRTGVSGDFEYLVRLLQPKPIDPRVGKRDLDVTRPGMGLPPIIDDAALAGVLRLGGALRVPQSSLSAEALAEAQTYEQWATPYPHPFQTALAKIVNLGASYTTLGADVAAVNDAAGLVAAGETDLDPWVVPPIYGRWHAAAERVLDSASGTPLPNRQNWLHELNLDPCHRATARFGTEAIQAGQEEYMDAAWRQVGDVLEANRRIRHAVLAKMASTSLHAATFRSLAAAQPGKILSLAAPVAGRIRTGAHTVRYRMRGSLVPPVMTSVAMRRALRPSARALRHLDFDTTTSPLPELITGLDDGELVAAPPKKPPAGIPTVDAVVAAMTPLVPLSSSSTATWLGCLALIFLLLAIVFALFGRYLLAVICLVLAVSLWLLRRRAIRVSAGLLVLSEDGLTVAAVDAMPIEDERYKHALEDMVVLIETSETIGEEPELGPLDVPATETGIIEALDPNVTIPVYIETTVEIPPRIRVVLDERFDEIMAYPEIDTPMYKPLVARSAENFLPNINLLEPNSLTLLETNQRFIEAYMVGLNHEFAAELLWRQYPTDQRGSAFRQFWDAASYLAANPNDPALREQLRDIPEIHRWSRTSQLGDHDHREAGGVPSEDLVLTIRGDLLKKYPTAVIYAHRARWQRTPGNKIDRTVPRLPVEITAVEEANPPHAKLRTPLYEAKVDPDIFFLGFDLTAAEALGGTSGTETDDPGWFFIIKERPGDPRFGLDEGAATGDLTVWNDLGWEDVVPGEVKAGEPAMFIQPTSSNFALTQPPTSDSARSEQYKEDKYITWMSNVDAARLAYILYQAPVLVAVHASKMLKVS
jgi:hypothetical protein